MENSDVEILTASGSYFSPTGWLCGLIADNGASSKEWKLIESLMLSGI